MKEILIEKAKNILNANYRPQGFTIPSEGLYPFQWNWDSGFIALGFAHFDIEKAKKEIETLLDAQWDNGLIPHIIFHTDSDTYFPGPDFHQSNLHPKSSKKYRSTGMVQPPVIGFILEEILRITDHDKDVLEFIRAHIDKVYKNHEYFYNYRDINDEGLVYIYHNWESGTDNSPIWDDIWATMDPPKYNFTRRDTSHVDAAQRPSNREYDYYLHIIDIAKKHHYSDKKIAELSPFLIIDPLFNTMLIKSNKALINLYKLLGNAKDKIQKLEHWIAKSEASFNKKLYDDDLKGYVHYDLRKDEKIKMLSSSSFTPVYANLPTKERMAEMTKTLEEKFGQGDKFLCASFDPTHHRYDPKRYWRGPVWINVNWMLYYGFKNYGYTALADRIKKDSIQLIHDYGFYEYFDARKEIIASVKKGYGGNNFSWSAALLIDLLND